MKTYKVKLILSIAVLLILSSVCSVLGADETTIESMLPAGYTKADVFKPGVGTPVGSILAARGDAVIIHKDSITGYQAVKGLPLYKGDIIVTRADGRIKLNLKDDSILTLLSNTWLELNESVYDSGKKSRFSFLKMGMGKVRFVIKKLMDMKRSEVQIETTTMICGLRGSDFVIVTQPARAEVTTFEDTELEVLSTVTPDATPILLGEYQRIAIEEGKLPGEPEGITPEEAASMKQEFEMTSEGDDGGADEREETRGASPDDVSAPGAYEILVSEDELVDPEAAVSAENLRGPTESDISEALQRDQELKNILNEHLEIKEIISEEEVIPGEEVIEELPGFPGMPE
jgi:hypothetical protein